MSDLSLSEVNAEIDRRKQLEAVNAEMKRRQTASPTTPPKPGQPVRSKDEARKMSQANIAASMKSQGITPEAAKQKGVNPAVEAAKTGHEDAASRARSEAALKATHDAQVYRFHGGGMGYNKAEQAKERAAAQQSSAKFQGLRTDPGTLLNQIQPHFDETLAQQQGAKGAIREKAAGLVNSLPDLLALAATEGLADIPEIAGQSLVTRGFQAQQVGGLAHEAADQDLRKKDPHKYYTSLLLGGLLAGAPDITHHAAKGLTKAVETPKLKLVEAKTAEPAKVEPQKPPASPGVRVGRVTPKEKPPVSPGVKVGRVTPKTAVKPPDVPQVKPKPQKATTASPKEETKEKSDAQESKPTLPGSESVRPKDSTVPAPATVQERSNTENHSARNGEKPTTDQPKPTETKPIDPEQSKAAKVHVEAERMRHGLPPLPDPIRTTHDDIREEAFARGLHHDAVKTAEEVIAKPRQMDKHELAANVIKKHEVKNSMNAIVGQIREGVKAGDDVSAKKAQYDALHEDLSKLTAATHRSGTEQSHAFSFRTHEVDDLSHANMTEIMEMKKPEKPLTDAEKKAIDERSEAFDAKQKALEEHLASDPESVAAADKALAAEKKAATRTARAKTKEQLDTEYEQLKTKFIKTSTGQLNSLADPKLIPIIKDMARNRVHAGALTVADVVDNIYSQLSQHVQGLTQRDVRDAWSGYGQGSKIPRDTADADLKEQARLMSKIEDVKKPLPKGPPRRVSAAVQKLRQDYATAKSNISPEERNLRRAKAEVASLQKKLAGKVEAAQKLTTVDTPEMQTPKKQLSDLRAEYTRRQKAAGPAPPIPEQAALAKMRRQAEELESRMEKGDIAARSKPKLSTVDDEATVAAKKELADADERLRIMQKTADYKRQTDRGSADTKVKAEKKAYDDKTKRLIEEMEAERRKFYAMANKRVPPTLAQRVVAGINAGRLSSPAQVAKVVASHAGTLGQDVLGDYIASGGDRLLGKMSGNGRTTMGTSLSQMGDRMRIFATQGLRESAAILRHGEEGARIQNLGQSSKEGMGLNYRVNSKVGQAMLNGVSNMHAIGYRPFRLAAFTRALQSEANLIAHKEGLKGSAYRARVKELIDNPTETMAAEASFAGDKAVSTQDNAFSKGVQRFSQGLTPGQQAVVKYILPFTKVPGNLAVKSFRNLPGVGILPDIMAQIGERGKPGLSPEMQRRWAQTLGKQVTGTALVAFGVQGAKGGWMTGFGPRKDNKPPGSIKIAGRWFQVDKIMPFNTAVLGSTIVESGSDKGEERAKKIVGGVAKDLAENPVSMAGEAVDQVMSGNKTYDALAYQASGVVPRLLSDLAATLDSKKRKTKGIVQDFQQDIPGLRNKLEPTGQPETRNLYDPFHSVKDSDTRAKSSSRGVRLPKMNADGSMRAPRAPRGMSLPKL